MSIGVVSNTVYAPLNTQIDADRDYRDLTGLESLEACACGGGMPQYIIPPGMQGLEADVPSDGVNITPLLVLLSAAGLWWWFDSQEE